MKQNSYDSFDPQNSSYSREDLEADARQAAKRAALGWHNVVGATPNELKQSEVQALILYGDIIDLPAPTSAKHPRQPREVRAAQFAPFAALTGYSDVIRETARYVEQKPELSEDEQANINSELKRIAGLLGKKDDKAPVATVTYFVPDVHKDGGAIIEESGPVKEVNARKQAMIFEQGAQIPFSDILACQIV